MKNTARKTIKDRMLPIVPFLLFAVLLVPYSWFNQQFVVEWFGCGCPQIDAQGNPVESWFNANDFTALFWHLVALCAAVMAGFLSKRIPGKRPWLRVLYVAGVLVMSLWIAGKFTQMMMWN